MIRLGCGYGSGSNRIGLTAPNMAVVAPTPSATVRTVIAVKPGALHARGAARVVRRESAGEMRGGGLIEVVLHFVGRVLIGSGAIGQRTKTARELTEE